MLKRPVLSLVLKGYPRLSETFIAQEILELQRAGFDLEIVSLRHPTDKTTHPIHDEITAPVRYLPEYLHHETGRVGRAFLQAMIMPGFVKALAVFIKDLSRDFTRNRIRRYGQALVLAAEARPQSELLYAHFLHTPTSVTRYAAKMRGLPFSISAHAKDIWTSPDWEIAEKLDDCQWLATCTKGGFEHLQSLAKDPQKVNLVYHGIDLSRFPAVTPDDTRRNGSEPDAPVRFVTVGRAVAKKGLDTLIASLAGLPDDLHWRWTHIGGGPLRDSLKDQARQLGIFERCDFLGAKPQVEVIEAYGNSDLFVMPCRIDETGDRDGLPNVFVEAQSQALPVVSTPISGIPELIEDGLNGVLVPPDDVQRLTDAMTMLARSPDRRKEMGQAGSEIVHDRFDHLTTIGTLIELFEETVPSSSHER